jgi:hypothetical protein
MTEIRSVLTLFLLILLTGIVHAQILNVSIIADPGYNQNIHAGDSGTFNSQFSYIAPIGNGIIFADVNPQTEGQTLNFRFSRPSKTDITGSVVTQSSGLFSGNVIITFTGGSSHTESYGIMQLLPMIPKESFFYATDGVNYYFVEADSAVPAMFFSGNAILHLDSSKDAYILVTSPYTNPITQVTWTPLNSGQYWVDTNYESLSDINNANQYANVTLNNNLNDDIFVLFGQIVNLIVNAALAVISFFNSIVSFSSWMYAISAFFFSIEIFFAGVTIYTLVALVLAMDSAGYGGKSDLMRGLSNFYRYEMYLVDFFIKIFMTIKELIKWW